MESIRRSGDARSLLEPFGPQQTSHDRNQRSQCRGDADGTVCVSMRPSQAIEFTDPRAHRGQGATEALLHALQDLACDQAVRGTEVGGRRVLDVVAHAQHEGAEDVGGEGAEREGRDDGVHVFGEVEAQEAAEWCEDDGEQDVAVFVDRRGCGDRGRGEDGEDDGADPAADGQNDADGVEVVTDEAEG